MSAFLGTAGSLIELPIYNAKPTVSHDRTVSTKRTLGGRVKVQRGARPRRAWTVTSERLTPAESAAMMALELGSTPPWVWVEPLARVTNLLSPEQSVLAPGTWSGTGVVEGGSVKIGAAYSPRSVSHSAGGTVNFAFRDGEADRPAVVPGIPVSVSAYLRGSGDLGISWRDYGNAVISSNQKSYSNSSLGRVSMVNLVVPAGAATAHIWATGFTQAAMPALTWTKALADWSVGRGCNRVVVEGLSEAGQEALYADPGASRSGLSFTIREVG
jgi:hypothetical protein